MQSCVDDMFATERESTIQSAYDAFMFMAKVCGWDVPLTKAPPPSGCINIIGAKLDLTPVPRLPAIFRILEHRMAEIAQAMQEALQTKRLGPGPSGKLYGQLGFACTQAWGRMGRAKLAPLKRRQYEEKANMNPQLAECLRWWVQWLREYRPREVPLNIAQRRVVLSYSDGEGRDAGVWIAIWPPGQRPLAAFLAVPREIRDAWAI